MADTRALVLNKFRWVEGHADVWSVFRDSEALASAVVALADPFREDGVTAVVGIESRGFLLGAATAVELGVGFVAVRKAGALFPGRKVKHRTAPDYRGNETELSVQQDSMRPGDRLLMVDDWAETGSQALAVQHLVSSCGAKLVGLSVLVDGLTESARRNLPRLHSVVRFDELPAE